MNVNRIYFTSRRGAWVQECDATVVSSMEGMNYYYYIFDTSLWQQGKKNPVLSFAHSKKLRESGEWSVLTLDSLCLPCCM